MNRLRYWIARALLSIRTDVLIQIASIGAIVVGFFLVGLASLGSLNLGRLTRHWSRGIQLVAYLKPDLPADQVDRLTHTLKQQSSVAAVRHISSRTAYHRLKESLGPYQNLLTGVEPGFLPASLELSLLETQPGHLRSLLALLNAAPQVEEVDYLGQWVKRLTSVVTLLRLGGLLIAITVGLACLYTISSTIRLGIFARREEIQILKLVGATDRYIRAPFLIEGAIQGLFGSLLAYGLLYLMFRFTAPEIEAFLASALSHLHLSFFSMGQLFIGISSGIFLGVVGSRLAFGRYLDV